MPARRSCAARARPVDVDAAVISNTRLSDDYSVVALAAPEVASLARPGQFVMVKPSRGSDPLLRRPFSIFEILREPDGTPLGVSLLNKRIGAGTGLLYETGPGARVGCLGPLGRPFEPVDPPAEAWMVAGGVGLAPFVTLAEALQARGTTTRCSTARAAPPSCTTSSCSNGSASSRCWPPKTGAGARRGYVTAALDAALAARAAAADVRLYVCGPTPMMRAVAGLAASRGTPCDVSLEQVMGCGLGGCYSCVVLARDETGAPHFIRSCIEGPVFDAARIVWDALCTH